MVFTDDLAFEMVTLVLAAATIAYTAFMGLVQYRRHGPAGLQESLSNSVGPIGITGAVALGLGLWTEFAWPFPATMASYDILFGDVYTLFGIVLVAFTVSVLLKAKLQFVGLLSMVAGVATIEYAYQGYLIGMTKTPWEMLGLFAAFGVAAIAAFPATLVADRLMAMATPASAPAPAVSDVPARVTSRLGIRAAQPISPGTSGSASMEEASSTESAVTVYRLPTYATVIVLVFFVIAVGAAIAAALFANNTIPSHLLHAP